MKNNSRNTRKNLLFLYEGQQRSLAEIVELTRQSYRKVYRRVVVNGWDILKAISEA
jgi:hypothetical protein